ncbi:unnamed protein product [Ranitomeya imitator]|uniref:imidazolonepropionase n=1 Tax=Ranitomeya imitator TaxID=111125 RepID=A0ABN9LWH7_9NEOB|nr:unnamed protein product [Ranitomeya imitator]
MADYALRILKRDTRICKMMADDDYMLACLLDPRYKGKLQNIMPHENLEQILATKQSTLVDRLIQAFPAHSTAQMDYAVPRYELPSRHFFCEKSHPSPPPSLIKIHFGTNLLADSAGALSMRPPFWKMAAPREKDGRTPAGSDRTLYRAAATKMPGKFRLLLQNAEQLVVVCQKQEDLRLIDCSGKCVLPGFVDAHTHPVWAGDRVHEFAMKLAGATYMDVHQAGGGIHFTVQHTEAATEEELFDSFQQRLEPRWLSARVDMG